MAKVMKEGCEPDDVIILIGDFWDGRIRASAVAFSVFRISRETLQHPVSGFDYSTRMLQAIVAGAGVNEMSQAELSYAPQALNKGTIQKDNFPRKQFNRSPDGVVKNLRETAPSVSRF
jgi:hypothetical protein